MCSLDKRAKEEGPNLGLVKMSRPMIIHLTGRKAVVIYGLHRPGDCGEARPARARRWPRC
jgi:hypothetical protein